MTEDERILSKEEDPNRPGRTYHPDFSDEALKVRQLVLNRYFNKVRRAIPDYPEVLNAVTCDKYCKVTGELDRRRYDFFIRF